MALPFVKHIYQVHRTPCTLLKLTVLAMSPLTQSHKILYLLLFKLTLLAMVLLTQSHISTESSTHYEAHCLGNGSSSTITKIHGIYY